MSRARDRVRGFFTALAAAAAVYFVGPGVLGLIKGITVFHALGVGSLVYTARRQRDAAKEARANARQPEITHKSAEAPRVRIYGTRRVGGNIAYWTTHGPEKRKLSMVVVLADHECDAITDVLVDDKSLGALDGNGYVQAGSPWFIDKLEVRTLKLQSVSGTVTLPDVPVAAVTVSLEPVGAGIGLASDDSPLPLSSFRTLVNGVDFLHSAGQTTVTFLGEYANLTLEADYLFVTYQVNVGTPLVRVKKYLGAAGQTADADLIADSENEWTADCRLENQCYLLLTFEWNETKAAAGLPNVSAIVRGAKVLDTRNGLTVWSDNWALCVRDYLVTQFGASANDINLTDLTDSANTSDEQVQVEGVEYGVEYVKRYTVNAVIYSDQNRGDVLEDMLLAGAGMAVWSGGKWRILCGKYRSPVSIALTDSDLTDAVRYRGKLPRNEAFNLVRGSYYDARLVDGVRLYTRTNYAPYSSAAYKSEDGGRELSRTIDFDMVTDYRVAHRLAKQIMHRTRNGARLVARWKLKALPIEVGDTVAVTLMRYGIVNKVFEVVERRFEFPASVELTMVETAAIVYDWTYTEAARVDPTPNTLLARPTEVAPLTFVVRCSAVADAAGPATYEILSDGTVSTYATVTWDARAVASEYVQVRWKRPYETVYRTVTSRPSETSLRIDGVSPGDVLTVAGWAINSIGARSDPFIVQEFRVPADLPVPGVAVPIGTNLLTNASYISPMAGGPVPELSAAAIGTNNYVGVSSLYWATIPVPPHGAMLGVGTAGPDGTSVPPDSGDGHYAFAYHTFVRVQPGFEYCAYAKLLPFECDAQVYVTWVDSNFMWMDEAWGNVVPSAGSAMDQFTTKRPNDLANYRYSTLFASPPPGAVFARFLWGATRNWSSANTKSVFAVEPYFGPVRPGTTQRPLWSAGALPVVDTNLIARGAATRIRTAKWDESMQATPRYIPVNDSTVEPLLAQSLAEVNAQPGDTIIYHVAATVSLPNGEYIRYATEPCRVRDDAGNLLYNPNWVDLTASGNRQQITLSDEFVQGEGSAAAARVGFFACATTWSIQIHRISVRVECVKR